jgi:predicted Zn-dependent peptidase
MVLEMEADRMARLKLDQALLDTERELVKEEYHWRVENNAWVNMIRKAVSHLYPNHPYQWGPIGLYQDIASVSLQEIQEFYNTHYTPNNAVLVIAGDVSHENALESAKKFFGSIPSKLLPQRPDLKINPDTVSSNYESDANYIVPVTLLSYYTPAINHPDSAPLSLLFRILTSGKNSRFNKRLSRDNELVTGFYPFIRQSTGSGLICFVSYHLPHFSGKIKAEIENQIKEISENGVKRHELVIAKNQVISELVFDQYEVTSVASRLGSYETAVDDYRFYYEKLRQLAGVTNEDIIGVAKKYLQLKNQKEISYKANNGKFYIWWYGLFKSIVA